MAQPQYSPDLTQAVFSVLRKLKALMKRKRSAMIEDDYWRYQQSRFKSVSRIGKNANLSVLHLRVDYFEAVKIVIDK